VIRLLIADDSALMRKLLEGIFREERDFDIRLARNGAEALELVRSFDPHVVTLDVQMPALDGLSCLSQIMIEKPRPVVMVSSLTVEGAEATLQAMELGAVDFIAKPSGTVSLEIDRLRPLLIEKVRGAASAKIRPSLRLAERIRHQFKGGEALLPVSPRSKKIRKSADVALGLVLIGTSTGGPAALDIVLPQLPKELLWPVLVAQHMPASFTAAFAKRLDRCCEMDVVEVNRPMQLQPATIYIARGDADVIVSRRLSGLHAMPTPARRDYLWHPSVERMVASALEHFDPARIIGVLMTGMGRDGADAMKELRQRGGWTIAEAESTAVVWGMPGELVKNGGAALIKPVTDIALAIRERVEKDAVH
jgi:two-component system, chemotaxis family, protein-glutamate methylesterase/glutaminase